MNDLDFSMFDQGTGPSSPVRAREPEPNVRPLPKKLQPHPLEDDSHLGQHILYDPAQENSLAGVTDLDGSVVLHHFSSFNGNPVKVTIDPSRLGQNAWSKAEKKASATPKSFFYTNPADRESFTEGMSHYVSKVPASVLYDMTNDPKRIVSRLAARGGFHIDKALSILKRLGFKGVFYSGSFPTVAMFHPTVGRRVDAEAPVRLARNPSGYGYCFECKAPFIRHDKSTSLVHCPNGHKRRYVGRPVKLKEDESSGWKTVYDDVPLAWADDFVNRHAKRHRGYEFRHVGNTQKPDTYRIEARRKGGKLRLAALRAPVGGVIVNNQFHQGGQILPRAFKRIATTVAAFRKRRVRLQESSSERMQAFQPLVDSMVDRIKSGTPAKSSEESKAGNRVDKWAATDAIGEQHRYHAALSQAYRRILAQLSTGPHQGILKDFGVLDKIRRLSEVHGKRGGGLRGQIAATSSDLNSAYSEAKQKVLTALAAATGKVKLARDPRDVLSKEDVAAGSRQEESFEKQLSDSMNNRPGILPTSEEIKSLAHAGASTRGQYEHAGRVLTSFIGRDNARLFVAANAILSPLAKWEHHSRAALRLVRLWRQEGSPDDPATVHSLVERLNPALENNEGERTESGEKIYPSIGWGIKSAKLRDLLSNPAKYIKKIENVAKSRRGKIVDFGRAFFDPTGVPIDTHMSKLTHPSASDVRAQTGDKDARAALRELVRDTRDQHSLARRIAESGSVDLQAPLLEAQKRLVSNDATYKAYKAAIAHAADQLGWEPRQVQECAWSAVVSIIAAKNTGVPTSAILQFLRHENAFEAWNVGGLLSTPEIQRDIRGLSKRPVEAFVAAANRPPAARGNIDPGNASAFADVAARVPGSNQRGAWLPIERSIRADTRPPF